VHPLSAAWVSTIGTSANLHPDFGAGLYDNSPIGIPWVSVPGTQPAKTVTFVWPGESDPGPYPIPDNPPIEGGSDRHILIVDRDNCILYELFNAQDVGGGNWHASSGAIFDLFSHSLRPDGWTSADAAGLPILPGLARQEEVAAGEIRHALRFTAPQTRDAHLWPARHDASSNTSQQYPPMGIRVRLKQSFDTGGFSTEARVIALALKRYGMILADNGSSWFVSGVPDEGWDNDHLNDLKQVHGSDFEVVDTSSLILDPDSGQVAPLFADDFESGGAGAWSGIVP